MRILIVEDERRCATRWPKSLRQKGYEVVTPATMAIPRWTGCWRRSTT